MSGPNAALALPPGDRDDAPIPPPLSGDPGSAGRLSGGPAAVDLAAAGGRLAAVLADAQTRLELTRRAIAAGDWPAAERQAWALAEALMADPRRQATALRQAVSAVRKARKEAA